LRVLAEIINEPHIGRSVPGIHLEGPYLSNEDGPRGAHNEHWIREIDWKEFLRLEQASNSKISIITLDPDKKGALEFIENCVKQNIVVGLGHHNASAARINKAVKAGARLATHLGNACPVYMHRHKNPIWPQLADKRLYASVIADGFHLIPEELIVFFKVKGVERLILISDMTQLSGMPAGEYTWNDQKINISAQGRVSLSDKDMLAGAYLPLIDNVANMIRICGCSLAQGIDMASKTPATLMQLYDRGEIALQKRADFVLFKQVDEKLIPHKTMVAGEIVYSVS